MVDWSYGMAGRASEPSRRMLRVKSDIDTELLPHFSIYPKLVVRQGPQLFHRRGTACRTRRARWSNMLGLRHSSRNFHTASTALSSKGISRS